MRAIRASMRETLGPPPLQPDRHGPVSGQEAGRISEVLGQGDAGHRLDLEGPDDADAVAPSDLGRVGWVHGLQPGVEGVQAIVSRLLLQPLPNGLVAAGSGEEAVEKRLDVEARPPDDHRQPAAGGDVLDRPGRPGGEVGSRKLVAPSHDVDQMVRDAAPLLEARLVRADVEAAVDLHGVAAYDLGPEPLGQQDGQGGLADGGGPDQEDQDAAFRGRCG
jgi:hypothetical protein